MTNEERLKSIVAQAEQSGWACPENSAYSLAVHAYDEGDGIRLIPELAVPVLLFNHDFAKAFFGEQEICSDCIQPLIFTKDKWVGKFQYDMYDCACGSQVQPNTEEAWKLRIQQAVLSENPLEYYYSKL